MGDSSGRETARKPFPSSLTVSRLIPFHLPLFVLSTRFFTSDNGNPEYGDMQGNLPLRGYKASNWSVCFRAPLFLTYADRSPIVPLACLCPRTHGSREGGIREPGMIRWPGHVKAGATSFEIVTTYDIYPVSGLFQ